MGKMIMFLILAGFGGGVITGIVGFNASDVQTQAAFLATSGLILTLTAAIAGLGAGVKFSNENRGHYRD